MLSQLEEKLKRLIKESDAPFLGLFGESLDEATKTAIEIAVIAKPGVQSYTNHLRTFPALFSVNLTSHLMQGMGQTGHFDIYPHLQRAIGTDKDFTQTEKEKLWKAFRLALLSLGYQPSPRTSGPHHMADEYLRQTGVPLRYVDDLAERMISFARAVGLPEDDNPESVANWQLLLDSKLGLPFSVTARNAIQKDTRGYYTHTFLKVHDANGQTTATSNALEKAMARAFQRQPGTSTFKRAVVPYLCNNEGVLGIFVPGGENREFELNVDGERQYFRSGADEKFITINADIPKEVTVKSLGNNQSNKYTLWEDSKSNRLLIFNDRGLFREGAQIGQSIDLPPGIYQIISRFEPEGIDCNELLDDPGLYSFDLTITPSKTHFLKNGVATLTIHGENQPFADWRGDRKVTKEGVEFFFGETNLDIEFPTDWLSISGYDYLLSISASGFNKSCDIPFSFDETGKTTVSISEIVRIHGWKPSFGRIKAEVFRLGERRALLRTSILYWHGLKTITRELKFDCHELPHNLEKVLSENIEANGSTIRSSDGLSRTIRLAFKIDERRNQTLTWNIPGVFIEVEQPSERGGIQRLKRPIGSVEVVSYASPKQIIVMASDPGELRIGNWSQKVDFSRNPSKHLPAALLASRITPQANTLTYRNAVTGIELELLKLAQPHNVNKVTAYIKNDEYVIRIHSPKEIEAISVNAFDVFSGKDIDIQLKANQGNYSTQLFGRSQLMCVRSEDGGFTSYVHLSLDDWPKGAWIFRFEASIDGSWGHLEDKEQRQFATSLVSKEEEPGHIFLSGNALATSSALTSWLSQLNVLSDKESLQVLGRAHQASLVHYTYEFKEQVPWLEKMWSMLLDRWKDREHDAGPGLINLLGVSPSEETQGNLLFPRQIQTVLPKVLALPADAYKNITTNDHPVMEALRLLPDIENQYPSLFPAPLHFAAAAGFSNFIEFSRGAAPKGFSLATYTAALPSFLSPIDRYRLGEDSFQIKPGDYLGPLHYLHAVQELEQVYDSTTANGSIMGETIGLAAYIRRTLPSLTNEDSPDMTGLSPHIIPWPADPNMVMPDSAHQRAENLDNIARLLSWYAYHCRLEHKLPGELEAFHKKLIASGVRVRLVMTYLLQVGESLFAYYLLLWEFIIKAKCIGG